MCGIHSHDGTPIGHHHGPAKRIYRPRPHPRSRRAFLGNVGRGTIAMAIVTPTALAGCSLETETTTTRIGVDPAASPTPAAESTSAASSTSTADGTANDTADSDSADSDTADPGDPSNPTAVPGSDTGLEPVTWARANLGFVSAYVLARGSTAAIVDTGVAGSAAAIGETLATLGLNYSDVAHVILTHNHSDHAGSISEVLAHAVNAAAYAGEADLGAIAGDIMGLVGGEDVFGFEMLPTPGHTPGHMAVIDHQAGLLVAGDAIFTEDGGVIEGPERFFDDIAQSRDSIKALAALTFNTLLVGHGDPIEQAADTAVAALAASF